NARDIVKTDEGAHWDVFRATTTGGATVLKVLRVEYIARYAQQLCNHLLVARALERLSDEKKLELYHGVHPCHKGSLRVGRLPAGVERRVPSVRRIAPRHRIEDCRPHRRYGSGNDS
ncbi:hypothetical protein MRX96_053534, partial [Rhipicephalus microplus]